MNRQDRRCGDDRCCRFTHRKQWKSDSHVRTGRTRQLPLPWLLLLLSVTTGLVDAISVLGLGKVFTANMTGNVVFPGFAGASAWRRSVTA
ncbi:DUF1275 family protein [Azospirillum sp. INR13]|uniref:DUF1275 family protein n=1 Tax=Azospirillum sp. INR13 TaxID=2596919 RepID=UPI0021068612|nr:DUF1275 family protein [Azospirillum sp. INR13]